MTKNEILLKYGAVALAGIATYFTPIKADMILVGGLVILDWITGMAKGIKDCNFKSTLVIRKFWISFGYLLAILISRLVELYFNNTVPIVKPMVAIIAISELQSLRENIKTLTGVDLLRSLEKYFQKNDSK